MRLSHRSVKISRDEPGEGLFIRLLVAAVSVPLFEVSLILGIHAATGGSNRLTFVLFHRIPISVHMAILGVAIAFSLVFGSKGLAWLMGHLFDTHHESQRNGIATCVLWGVVLAIAAYGYRLGR